MINRFLILGLTLTTLSLISCFSSCKKEDPINLTKQPIVTNDTSPEYQVKFADYTGWTYNENIYEVNIRQYTPEGTFKAFQQELPRLKNMGVGILWLMPINPIGEVNRKGSLGSYYSVKDYEKVNDEFGSMRDFKDLVSAAHKKDMYIIVDWVANHTSWDNTLTRTNPDYYLKTEAGEFQPPLGQDWADVIQLDYYNEELQNYMIQTLKDWVIKTGIDGFRFDYVDGVPEAFWRKANAELKALKPDIFLIAEGDGKKYHSMGFDMDYCWGLQGWDVGTMRQIYEGKKSVSDLNNFFNAEKSLYMPNYYHMYFTSNHDENSWHGTEFQQLGGSHKAFAVLTQTLYGMPLIYSGQEAAMRKQLNFFEKDDIDWTNLEYESFYKTFNDLRKTNKALWNGNAGGIPIRISTNNDQNIFAFSRTKDNDQVMVLLNLSANNQTFKLNTDAYAADYNNIINNETVNLSQTNSISLVAWGYMVLVK